MTIYVDVETRWYHTEFYTITDDYYNDLYFILLSFLESILQELCFVYKECRRFEFGKVRCRKYRWAKMIRMNNLNQQKNLSSFYVILCRFKRALFIISHTVEETFYILNMICWILKIPWDSVSLNRLCIETKIFLLDPAGHRSLRKDFSIKTPSLLAVSISSFIHVVDIYIRINYYLDMQS